jgi:hypothetical protein
MNKFTFSSPDLKDEYENLRSNVLGKTNCCRGFAVFLRRGMAAWMGVLQTPADHEAVKIREPVNHPTGFRKRNALILVLADVTIALHGLTD